MSGISRRGVRALARLAAAALVATPACQRDEPGGPSEDSPAFAAPRLVVVYAPCTVNKHYLAPYAADVSTTPHLARFARDSLVFERHQSEAGFSGIAYASLWTGGQATEHGIYSHPERLPDASYTMAEAFADAGYQTLFYDQHGMASRRLNYGQGVQALDSHQRRLTGDDRYFQRALDRLATDPDARVFVMTAFTVSHKPYHEYAELETFCAEYPDECPNGPATPHYQRLATDLELLGGLSLDFPATVERAGISAEELRAYIEECELLYRASLSHLDRLFGGVVEAIRARGLLDESLIVFTADHGEVLYRENALFQWSHGFELAPEVLGVPLLIRGPGTGVRPGRLAAVTRSVDVFPTVAALAGIELPEAPRGTDLAPAARGLAPAPDAPAFSHTTYLPPKMLENARRYRHGLFLSFYPRSEIELVWVSAREGDMVYKLRNQGGEQFGLEAYDLADDPTESRNVYAAGDTRHRAMGERLRTYRARLIADWHARRDGTAPEGIPDAERERLLRGLGYIE